MSGGPSSTTVRGAAPTPFQVLSFAVGQTQPFAKVVAVLPGETYELRSDAQSVDEFDTGVVVTYPLCYVGDGQAQQTLAPGQGMPFSRVAPIVVTAKTRTLLVSVDAACTVWISKVEDGSTLKHDGQKAPCGCGGIGPLPSSSSSSKKPCGCSRV